MNLYHARQFRRETRVVLKTAPLRKGMTMKHIPEPSTQQPNTWRTAMSYALMPAATSDGWDTVPKDEGNLIRGKMVKFKDRRYWLDKVNEITGATLVVVEVKTVWVKWEDKLPVQ